MTEEKSRILNMLEEGKITSEEAAMLLDQLDGRPLTQHAAPIYASDDARMLRVRIRVVEADKPKPTNVDLNLPLKAARIAGRLIATMMPEQARATMAENGLDLSQMDLVELIDALAETGGDIVNITNEDEQAQVSVRVYVE